jgi:hypothetical protein
METIQAYLGNLSDILGVLGIVGSLLFTAITIRSESRSRQAANLLAITSAHREIWTAMIDKPALHRVLERTADLKSMPITSEESLFVMFLINHLAASWHAMESRMLPAREAVEADIRMFFALPIPKEVWGRTRGLQDPRFRRFMDRVLDR